MLQNLFFRLFELWESEMGDRITEQIALVELNQVCYFLVKLMKLYSSNFETNMQIF